STRSSRSRARTRCSASPPPRRRLARAYCRSSRDVTRTGTPQRRSGGVGSTAGGGGAQERDDDVVRDLVDALEAQAALAAVDVPEAVAEAVDHGRLDVERHVPLLRGQ